MTRGLRYSSVAVMPAALRARVTVQQRTASALREAETPADRGTGAVTRKLRRDDEHNEQVVFFTPIRTLALNDTRYAVAAARTFAIPNGGGRSKRDAGRLKAEGVTREVSDIFCSVARDGMHGLYIELKSMTGCASREQRRSEEHTSELQSPLNLVCR